MRVKKLTEKQLNELESLTDWSLTLMQYMQQTVDEESFMMKRFEEVVHETWKKRPARHAHPLQRPQAMCKKHAERTPYNPSLNEA